MLTRVGVVGWRREGQVQGQLERLLSHVGNDAVEEGTGALKAGVGVDFDEPRLELAVDHEIKAKYFEVVDEVARSDLGIDTPNCVSAHLLHEGQDVLPEVVLLG